MNIFFTPLKFTSVKYPGRFHHIVSIPASVTIMSLTAIFIYPRNITILGENGIFDKISSILPVLGGFFIAALTVIVSQDHQLLREKMNGSKKPFLKGENEPLTRIRFLSLLFGYLSFSSFFLMAMIFLIEAVAPGIRKDAYEWIWISCKGLAIGVVAFWLSHMFSATMIGLHYFSDRLYRSNDKANFRKRLPPID